MECDPVLTLRLGDCVDVMASFDEASLGAVVCDPPYGIEFMGKEWDDLGAVKRANRGDHMNWKRMPGENSKAPKFQLPQPAFDLSLKSSQRMQEWHIAWLTEAYRALKPGGVIKAFSGSRTFHRLGAAMAEVGFTGLRLEAWTYGSGFPKSMDVSKALDKAAGAEREVVGAHPWAALRVNVTAQTDKYGAGTTPGPTTITAPATPEAAQWQGWGTALKPAWEPVVVGVKPCG